MPETRRLAAGKLVLASHNAGKLVELRAFLAPRGFVVLSAAELGLPAPAESGETFRANAALKALAAAGASGLPSLADDSGLLIAALNGAPGVHTADWAMRPDGGRDYGLAMARIAREAGDTPDRSCAFVSVLALAWPDGHVQFHEGRVDGNWIYPPRGDLGFGYDPMFVPDHARRSYGEMSLAEKNETNHRARAFEDFARHCL